MPMVFVALNRKPLFGDGAMVLRDPAGPSSAHTEQAPANDRRTEMRQSKPRRRPGRRMKGRRARSRRGKARNRHLHLHLHLQIHLCPQTHASSDLRWHGCYPTAGFRSLANGARQKYYAALLFKARISGLPEGKRASRGALLRAPPPAVEGGAGLGCAGMGGGGRGSAMTASSHRAWHVGRWAACDGVGRPL